MTVTNFCICIASLRAVVDLMTDIGILGSLLQPNLFFTSWILDV
jgi:hypothetical protein